jgi:hypothetical protein
MACVAGLVGLWSCSGGSNGTDSVAGDGRAPEQEAGDAATDAAGEVMAEVRAGPSVTLLAAGKTSHVIVLQPGASASEVQAAEELRSHFKLCTGIELEVEADVASPLEMPMIVLGQGPVADALGVSPTAEELGEQGFRLRTVGQNIVIAGTREVGTLYGVHRFLEERLGVRWYAPGVTKTPETTALAVPSTDELRRPAFWWRHTSYEWPGRDDAFMARQGDNDGEGGEENPYGLEHSHDGRAHSYFWYLHPDEFFDEHPEYFSEVGGVRLRDETQLCLTNPDVLEIVTERMLQRMEEHPEAGQHNFSQMDRYNYCQCDACRAMNEKYQTTGGTQFWFVNELAKRTSLEHPEKLVGTLAYMWTEEPPVGLEMHPNVAVWLCHMYPSCDSHPIESCPLNADYKRRAESWSQLTEHLYVWHYIVDFMHYYNPFPNFTAMAADMRFYRDLGVEGIYLQGMGQDGGGGEFSLLRPYYGMKLLFDPDQDPTALRKDFLEGYYGAAAGAIGEYIDLLLAEVKDKDIHMHLYTNPAQGYLPDPVVEEAEQLFDEAAAAASGNAELADRVTVARMPLTYARLFPRNGYEVAGGKLNWLGEIAPAEEVTGFLELMASHGFKLVREVGGDPALLVLASSMFQSPLPVTVLDNGALEVDIVPLLGGRVLRVIDKPSGQCVTAHNVKQNLFFPFAGGLEDRIGGMFEAYGWVEPAVVVKVEAHEAELVLTTMNGYQLTRTFTLDPEKPELTVKTRVTNTSAQAQEGRFRFHLELDLGELHETRYAFKTVGGGAEESGLEEVIAGLREGVHFYGQAVPSGAWTFSGTKGLAVTQSFDQASVEAAWLYAYPDTLGELEAELWGPKLTLSAGESHEFSYKLDVQTD